MYRTDPSLVNNGVSKAAMCDKASGSLFANNGNRARCTRSGAKRSDAQIANQVRTDDDNNHRRIPALFPEDHHVAVWLAVERVRSPVSHKHAPHDCRGAWDRHEDDVSRVTFVMEVAVLAQDSDQVHGMVRARCEDVLVDDAIHARPT
jgi:hypothetical protein